MPIELDHLFVCAAPGAPEAETLVRLGLHEGPPNHHPGQGSASRRFAFTNAMLELFWVTDPAEAQSARTKPTLLWERWSGRQQKASPFGICLRPADDWDTRPPFPAWQYRPEYLPDPLFMDIGEAGAEEPMWVYLSFLRRAQRQQHFVEHPIGIREITALTLTTPVPLRSEASQKVVASGILLARPGPASLLEIEFDGNPRTQILDLRPHLPLIFRL